MKKFVFSLICLPLIFSASFAQESKAPRVVDFSSMDSADEIAPPKSLVSTGSVSTFEEVDTPLEQGFVPLSETENPFLGTKNLSTTYSKKWKKKYKNLLEFQKRKIRFNITRENNKDFLMKGTTAIPMSIFHNSAVIHQLEDNVEAIRFMRSGGMKKKTGLFALILSEVIMIGALGSKNLGLSLGGLAGVLGSFWILKNAEDDFRDGVRTYHRGLREELDLTPEEAF